MALVNDDAEMLRLAREIDGRAPLWHVTWSPYGRMFWAYAMFLPISFVLACSAPEELTGWMRQVELRYVRANGPAGPEGEPVGPSAASQPPASVANPSPRSRERSPEWSRGPRPRPRSRRGDAGHEPRT